MGTVTTPTMRYNTGFHNWHMYAIVCEHADGQFVVKFGVSTDPFRRLMQLSPGIAFKFVTLVTPPMAKDSAFRMESQMHKFFADRRTRGEWFAFDMDSKESFKPALRYHYVRQMGVEPTFSIITDEQFSAFCSLHNQEIRKPTGMLYKKFRLANGLAR